MCIIKLQYNCIPWLCNEYSVTLIYLTQKPILSAKPEKTKTCKTKKGNLTNTIGSCVN